MRREYTKPEIKIVSFITENIATSAISTGEMQNAANIATLYSAKSDS
ncbi:MAG: hypothetical protein LUC92_05985 [Clostridiales bacterium]|nr:hypothetical protein [Clostridiales bacterium]